MARAKWPTPVVNLEGARSRLAERAYQATRQRLADWVHPPPPPPPTAPVGSTADTRGRLRQWRDHVQVLSNGASQRNFCLVCCHTARTPRALMRTPCTGVTADPPRALRLAIAAGGFDSGLQALRHRHSRRVAALHPGPWIGAPSTGGSTDSVADGQRAEVAEHATGLRPGVPDGAHGTLPPGAAALAAAGVGDEATREPPVGAHPANVALKRKLAEVDLGTAPAVRPDGNRDSVKYRKRESLVVDELDWLPPHPPSNQTTLCMGILRQDPVGGQGSGPRFGATVLSRVVETRQSVRGVSLLARLRR